VVNRRTRIAKNANPYKNNNRYPKDGSMLRRSANKSPFRPEFQALALGRRDDVDDSVGRREESKYRI
jgi:hypothetical protein